MLLWLMNMGFAGGSSGGGGGGGTALVSRITLGIGIGIRSVVLLLIGKAISSGS